MLQRTTSECLSGDVSLVLRNHFSQSIGHLIATLRTLRASEPSTVEQFLLKTLPLAADVSRAAISSGESNAELSRQSIVFLGILCGVANGFAVSDEQYERALSDARDCFREMAAKGRRADLRLLLNAALLAVRGPQEMLSDVWKPRFSWNIFRHYRPVKLHHFPLVLRALLTGWKQAMGNKRLTWTPLDFLDVCETVSTALSSICKSEHSTFGSCATSPLVFKDVSHIAVDLDKQKACLLSFATACGVLRAVQRNPKAIMPELESKLLDCVRDTIKYRMGILNQFGLSSGLQTSSSSNWDAITILLLSSSVSAFVVRVLDSEELHNFRLAIECLISQATKERSVGKDSDAYHLQVHRCIKKHSITLGSAFARVVARERSVYSCIGFLQSLISQNATNLSACRFVFAAGMTCKWTPDISLAFLDVLSLARNQTVSTRESATQSLGAVICKDIDVISMLGEMVLCVIAEPTYHGDHARANYLLRGLATVFAERRKKAMHVADRGKPISANSARNEEAETRWVLLVAHIMEAFKQNAGEEEFALACIDCFSRIMELKEITWCLAGQELIQKLPKVLLEDYLFVDLPVQQEKRLIHVVVVLDIICEKIADEETYSKFMAALMNNASRIGERSDRIVGVLLLRCMTRCNEEVLDVALKAVTEFVGSNTDRKYRFLPLIRTAVLGADTAKKDKCVQWILEVFGNLTKSDVSKMRSPAQPPRVAKL